MENQDQATGEVNDEVKNEVKETANPLIPTDPADVPDTDVEDEIENEPATVKPAEDYSPKAWSPEEERIFSENALPADELIFRDSGTIMPSLGEDGYFVLGMSAPEDSEGDPEATQEVTPEPSEPSEQSEADRMEALCRMNAAGSGIKSIEGQFAWLCSRYSLSDSLTTAEKLAKLETVCRSNHC